MWLVFFKNLELEMKFDNLTRVNCISYIDLVENLVEKVTCVKLSNFLSSSKFLNTNQMLICAFLCITILYNTLRKILYNTLRYFT